MTEMRDIQSLMRATEKEKTHFFVWYVDEKNDIIIVYKKVCRRCADDLKFSILNFVYQSKIGVLSLDQKWIGYGAHIRWLESVQAELATLLTSARS